MLTDVHLEEENLKFEVDNFNNEVQAELEEERDQLEHNQQQQSEPQTIAVIGKEKPLEEVHEYKKEGRRFKINGYWYNFGKEFKSKDKYYSCNKRQTKNCQGSITITRDRHIHKTIQHTCDTAAEIDSKKNVKVDVEI